MTDPNDSIERSVGSVTSSWLARVCAGDDDAWHRLEHVYRRLICWWCAKSGVPGQDIDDVVQHVFAATAKALPNFDNKNFRGFLWKITRNKVQDYWRNKGKEPAAQGGSSIQQILANVEAESTQRLGKVDQATKIVFDAVVDFVKGEFSGQDWQAFWKYAVNGEPAAVVAESLEISRNQVYLAKSRILRRIRQEFEDEAASVRS